MTRSRTIVGIVLLVGLATLACYLAGFLAPTEANEKASESPAESVAGPSSSFPIQDSRRSTATSREALDGLREKERGTDATAELVLRVRNIDKTAASGVVSWCCSTDPRVCSRSLPTFTGTSLDDVRQAAFEGTARLPVLAMSWIWIKVTRKDSPLRAWFLRTAPFTGKKVRDLLLETETRTIHVFVWNPELTGPAAHCSVSIYAADLQSGIQPTLIRKIETDTGGYAVATRLPPGRFFIAGPGSGLSDAYPYCVQVILAKDMPVVEATSVLMAAPKSEDVEIRLHARFTTANRQRIQPKLFLRRLDDGSGKAYPIPGVITPGRRSYRLRLPPGTYEAGTLPLGTFELIGPEAYLQVSEKASSPFEIVATAKRRSTVLKLEGLAEKHLPVTVHPCRGDALIGEDDALLFLGDYKWRAVTNRVPELPYPCRLVVSGNGRTFLSRPGLKIRGNRVVAPLIPAMRLHVRWVEGTIACAEAFLRCRVGSDTVETRMTRRIIQDRGEMVPAFATSVVVPWGRANLECCGADGAIQWTRMHEPRTSPATIDVRNH